MRKTIFVASLLALSGCGGEDGGTAGPEPIDVASLSACDAVKALSAGMDEAPPFASLVRDPVEGESSFAGKVTDASPWGTSCTYGTVRGWQEKDPDTYVFRCPIYQNGPASFESAKPTAEAAFAEARETLNECLGDEWTERENDMEQGGEESISYIYERPADIERAETADFYMYPVMLRKAFYRSPESRGGPWGWIVDVAFQQPEADTSE